MDEFVSKKLLVAKFNELASKYIDGDKRQRGLAYTTAADMIALADAADVQPVNQWISVDEKLPKTGESVLVCVAINKNLKGFGECKPEMRIGWLDDGDKWALQFSNMNYSEVLCWMPLPEPPKDGETK